MSTENAEWPGAYGATVEIRIHDVPAFRATFFEVETS